MNLETRVHAICDKYPVCNPETPSEEPVNPLFILSLIFLGLALIGLRRYTK